MDLTGAKITQGDWSRTVLTGWVNAVDTLRNEARGSFSIVAVDVISLARGPIRVVANDLSFEVLLLTPSPSQIPGTFRWRFVARCEAHAVAPFVRPNPSLTATQEVFIGKPITQDKPGSGAD